MRAMQAVMSWNDCARGVDIAPLRRPQGASDPDAGLVECLRRHEEGAAEALLAAYGNRVYRLALHITGNSSDAEEAVQDALWAATRKIDTFLGTAAFGSWIYRITANAACQKRRKRRVERAEVAFGEWTDDGRIRHPSFQGLRADKAPRDVAQETPVGRASLAVVHRAELADGRPVAVKVLRPGVDAVIATDLHLMRPLFDFLSLRVGVSEAGQLGAHELLERQFVVCEEHTQGFLRRCGQNLPPCPNLCSECPIAVACCGRFVAG